MQFHEHFERHNFDIETVKVIFVEDEEISFYTSKWT